MYISGRFRCNPYRKRQELAGIDLVSSRFRQDPLDETISLGTDQTGQVSNFYVDLQKHSEIFQLFLTRIKDFCVLFSLFQI